MAKEHSVLLLDEFIAAASELGGDDKTCIKPKPITVQNEDSIFLENISKFENRIKHILHVNQDKTIKSIVHTGETDSSEDEDQRDFELHKYNECGRDIRRLLVDSSSSTSCDSAPSSTWKPKVQKTPTNQVGLPTKQIPKPVVDINVYTDPIFGLRLVNPLISSITLQDRMKGRTAVTMSRMKLHLTKLNPNDDWVFAGAIVSKVVKTSQKGNQYSIWTISDLQNDLKTVALFMFSGAHKNLWKTVQGTVVGVLNPAVMEQNEKSSDEATFSVNNADRIMVMGQSKDLGTCRSQKKSGDPCTAFVNKNRCEYCIYHVKAAYQKFSGRSDLQSSFVGGGPNALRNKVLGKNEVFYAGKSFTAVKAPSKRSTQKLRIKDEGILEALSSGVRVNTDVNIRAKNLSKGAANKLDASVCQRKKDLELLQKLTASPKQIEEVPCSNRKRISKMPVNENIMKTNTQYDLNRFSSGLEAKMDFDGTVSSSVTLTESKGTALDVIAKLKMRNVAEKKTKDIVLNDKAQYDRTFDLFSNKIDTKTDFDGTVSYNITLAESKNRASDVISKLKEKKFDQKKTDMILNEDETNGSGMEYLSSISNDDIDDLNYDSDDLNNDKSNREAIPKSSEPRASSTIVSKSKFLTSNNISSCIESEKSTKLSDLRNEPRHKISQTVKVATHNKAIYSTSKSNLPLDIPLLSGFSGKPIDLNAPISKSKLSRAKQNAITYVQRHGPIAKVDPNVRGTKRKATIVSDISTPAAKKLKEIQENEFMTQRFKKIMAASSKHPELLQKVDDEEQEKYFHKMEIKEKMEEKMLGTFKVNCKAVRCLKCKYTNFSASDRCKAEKHPLKVFDTVKRFFKCNCGNRIVSLTVVPLEGCQKCTTGKWERCAMIAERNVKTLTQLSIRGGEERFVGGSVTNANINLMVPDEGIQ